MKKLFLLLTMISTLFLLTGCDLFNNFEKDVYKSNFVTYDIVELSFDVNGETKKVKFEYSFDISTVAARDMLNLVSALDGYMSSGMKLSTTGKFAHFSEYYSHNEEQAPKSSQSRFSNEQKNFATNAEGGVSIYTPSGSGDFFGNANIMFCLEKICYSEEDNNSFVIGRVTEGLDILKNISLTDVIDNYSITRVVEDQFDSSNDVFIEIKWEGYEVPLQLRLYRKVAPKTVDNFVRYVQKDYYTGLEMHRIIEDFMIQGGDGKPYNTPITGEFMNNGHINLLQHTPGTIAMARTNDMNSATDQFYIATGDLALQLDPNYAAFGLPISGVQTAIDISTVNTDASDKPTTPVIIEYIKVIENPLS